MKIKQKIYAVFTLFLIGSTLLQAQSKTVQNDVTSVKLIHQLSDVVNPDQVVWSKIVWDYIDLTIPENRDIRFNIQPNNGADIKRSIFDFLVNQINTNKDVEVFTNSFFTEKMTAKEVQSKLTSIRKKGDYTDVFTVKTDDVYGLLLKGFWYFDKTESKARYKLLGIAPMGPDIQTVGVQDVNDNSLYELFWIYYPTLRKDLHTVMVVNGNSQARKIPLDYYLSKRQFKAERIDENVVNNSTKPFSYSRKGLFQLKKDSILVDSVLFKKVNTFWYKKKISKTAQDKKTLREILKKNKAYKKEQAAKKRAARKKEKNNT